MSAVSKGKIMMLRELLKNKSVNIDAKDPYSGVSAFWLACLYGHGKIMSILAEEGADVYVINKFKINVLHLAVYKNHISIVKMLI